MLNSWPWWLVWQLGKLSNCFCINFFCSTAAAINSYLPPFCLFLSHQHACLPLCSIKIIFSWRPSRINLLSHSNVFSFLFAWFSFWVSPLSACFSFIIREKKVPDLPLDLSVLAYNQRPRLIPEHFFLPLKLLWFWSALFSLDSSANAVTSGATWPLNSPSFLIEIAASFSSLDVPPTLRSKIDTLETCSSISNWIMFCKSSKYSRVNV